MERVTARRLRRLERSRAPAADPRAQWEARQRAWRERWWAAAQAIVRDGMPPEFGALVVAELNAGTPPAEQSALARRVCSLAAHAAYSVDALYPNRGPLVVPRAHCVLLVTLPVDEVLFASLACQACHLEVPYASGRALTRARGEGRALGARYLDVCAHCGSTDIAWPREWGR